MSPNPSSASPVNAQSFPNVAGAPETRSGGTEIFPTKIAEPLYLNRDLSWLEFNRRVLHEALDRRTPLLERVQFLAIFTSNLDEFFMKRVGALKRSVAAGLVQTGPDGRTPAQTLAAIRQAVLPMLTQQSRCFEQEILPELARNGIHLLNWENLSPAERGFANKYFQQSVFPVLTPLAVDPGHPFPFISNLSTSLAVKLRHPDREENLFARVKVPEVLPRYVRLQGGAPDEYRYVHLRDIVEHNLDKLFPDMVVLGVTSFRITRNAEMDRDEEDAEDILEMIEQELRQRRFAKVLRIEHGPNPDPWIRQFLMEELEIDEEDIYEVSGSLDFTDLGKLREVIRPVLRFDPWTPQVPPRLADDELDFFSIIREGDLLVHHPYESFSNSVERFIAAAADDPKVLAIKMTVYRTGSDSAFIPTLIRAAENGKQVVCLVELKARFDEERNIHWALALEKAGVHVVYGIVGLKTHCKTALVVRQETDGLRCYAHIGTGNYNGSTARLYTDFGLLTCRTDLIEDIIELFHYLTGRSLKKSYRKLLVAPVNIRDRFVQMIEREAEHHKGGRPSGIIAKMNSLEDRTICRALYASSSVGVETDLIVRGFCCLRPGVPGLSDNIRVRSVIGRFLEHSRVFYFRNGAKDPLDGEFFIGSADWMYRNLLARVEVVTPVEDRPLREKLWESLQIMLQDSRQAWEMSADGSYTQKVPSDGSPGALGTHQMLMNQTRQRCVAQ